MRALAAILVATLATWLATPAVASVTCRREVVHCAHCPKPKALEVPALRADCCIVTPGVAHPVADGVQPRFEPTAPGLAGAAAARVGELALVSAVTSVPEITGSPPLRTRNLPLLR